MKRLSSILTVIIICGMIAGCSNSDSSLSPADKLAITANANDNTVSILDTNSLSKIGDDIPLSGIWPMEITLSVDGATAYVVCRDSDSISIIDMAGSSETGTIALTGTEPTKAVIAGDGFLYVAYRGSDFLSKVDIAADTPAETYQITLTGDQNYSIAVTPDGLNLYVGAYEYGRLSKVNVNTGSETDYWTAVDDDIPYYIYDIEIAEDGLAYLASYDRGEIKRWNTTDDTWAESLATGQDYEWMVDLALDGTMLVGTFNADGNSGGVVLIDTTADWADYEFAQDDDGSYTVDLPFTFTFNGKSATEVTVDSNGAVSFNGATSYETGIETITGFSPNNENLDSDEEIFNYSSRTFADHAVFQWSTAMYDDYYNPNTVTIFEVVLGNDGTARFDYLFSMPGAIGEDDEYSYGVGDGTNALVNMRATLGSPFNFERQSFLWDPETPTTMTEEPFEWEGTGVLHLPVTGQPHGIAMTSDYAFIPLSKDYETGLASTTVQVYDKETMLPAGTITVGAGPRAIAIQP